MAAVLDRKAILRDKRAQGIAAMGLVNREGDRFRVTTPAARGRQSSHEVWRDETGIVRCSCLEFTEQSENDPLFRCEHILAVKHAIRNRSSEAVTKPRSENSVTASNTTEEKAGEPDAATDEVASDAEAGVLEAPAAAQPEPQRASVVPLAFSHTLRLLRQPIDPTFVKTSEHQVGDDFQPRIGRDVEWQMVVDMLDRVVPTWSYAIRNIVQVGELVSVTAAITIEGVTREGLGTGNARTESGIGRAEEEALKRAAARFGVAREPVRSDSEAISQPAGAPATGGFPSDPRANSMADLVAPRQLGIIRALGREVDLDVEQESLKLFSCGTQELSKGAASSLIEHLGQLRPAPAVGIRRAS